MAQTKRITFDTHETVKELEQAGFNSRQAEVQVKILKDLLGGEVATKKDLEATELNLKNKIELVESKLEGKIDSIVNQLTVKIEKSNLNNIKWMSSGLLVNTGLIFTILKVLSY